MIEVNIYSPFKASILVPENWDELSKEQICAIGEVLFDDELNADKVLQRYRLMRCLMMEIPIAKLHKVQAETVAEELIPLCDWIVKDCKLTNQKIPVLNIGGQKYYGPYSHLSNLVAIEFDFAERSLYDWNMDRGNTELLYRFIACIYRPQRKGAHWYAPYDKKKDPDGDIRCQFNSNLISHYTRELQKCLSVKDAYAIVLWYQGCRQFMSELHPRIFEAESSEDSVAENNGPAYFNLLRKIAAAGTYGTFSYVEQMPIYTLFEEMESAISEQEAIKKHIEEAKNGQ